MSQNNLDRVGGSTHRDPQAKPCVQDGGGGQRATPSGAAQKRPAAKSPGLHSTPLAKRRVPHSTSEQSTRYGVTTGLMDLSEDVLLMIVSYLRRSADILNLSESCSRLKRVCSDKSLWIDVRNDLPLTCRELRKTLDFLNERTKSIMIRGFLKSKHGDKTRETLSPSVLQSMEAKCPALTELALNECLLDANKIKISLLPPSLETLSLESSEVVNIQETASFFKDIHLRLTCLKKLNLRKCGWVSNHSLLAICKCEELIELDLSGCFRIGECFAYTALAARFGFRKLQKLDLRDSGAGDSEVPCFARLPRITHLLMGFRQREGRQQILHHDIIGDRGLSSILSYDGNDFSNQLKFLSVTHTNMTDRIFGRLAASLPNLLELDVRGTAVTEDAVLSVKRKRPDFRVIWSEDERIKDV